MAATASAGPSPSAAAAYNLVRLPKLADGGRHECARRLPVDRPLAHHRGRPVGSCLISTSMARHDHHRRGNRGENRLRRYAGDPRPRLQPLNGLLHMDPASTKWTRSQATVMPNCSMTAPSRSQFAYHNGDGGHPRPSGILLQHTASPSQEVCRKRRKALRHRQPSSSRPQRIHRRRVIRSVQLRAVTSSKGCGQGR